MTDRKCVFVCGAAIIIVSTIILPWVTTVGLAHQGLSSSQITFTQTLESNITSFQGIEYSIDFRRENLSLTVIGENTNEREIRYAGIVVKVDRYRLFRNNVTFEPGEIKSWEINVIDGLDALEKSHYVIVSTYGDSAQLNFTREIAPSNPGPVPTPYIENVQIANGTIDGEPSAVAKVTIVNPSIQTYPTALAVHTLGTDGSFYPASVRPGGSTTITVELLDERGTQIAGEARLYAGNLSKGDGAMDQVGFVGQADDETKTWNETYEPVREPWRDDGYQYHNATYENNESIAEQLSGGYEIFGIPVIYLAAGMLVGLAIIRRRS